MKSEIQNPENLETQTLMKIFIALPEGEPFIFLTPQGTGKDVMQRVRSEVSRSRGKLKKAGHKLKQFRITSPIESYEDATGTVFDKITVTKVYTIGNKVSELLEDMTIGAKE